MDGITSPWDSGTKLYEHALDIRGAIHDVIAANVANEETPGYRAMDLPFKAALDAAVNGRGSLSLNGTDDQHLGTAGANNPSFLQVITQRGGGGLDGNTVNLEQQLTEMAENSVLYMAVAQFLSGRFDGWRDAIDEGRR